MSLFGRIIPVPSEAILPQPEGYPYVVNDKLGDPRMIWRGSPLPRRQRPGRRLYDNGGLTVEKLIQAKAFMGDTRPAYADAVRQHGSQRKAAAALGVSLGKLQRGLRK